MITKPADALTGTRYVIEGSKEIADEEIGAPDGTTFLVGSVLQYPCQTQIFKDGTDRGHLHQ